MDVNDLNRQHSVHGFRACFYKNNFYKNTTRLRFLKSYEYAKNICQPEIQVLDLRMSRFLGKKVCLLLRNII